VARHGVRRRLLLLVLVLVLLLVLLVVGVVLLLVVLVVVRVLLVVLLLLLAVMLRRLVRVRRVPVVAVVAVVHPWGGGGLAVGRCGSWWVVGANGSMASLSSSALSLFSINKGPRFSPTQGKGMVNVTLLLQL